MPLLDHFHPPLSRTHPWRSFHGAWAVAIARLLNGGVLPSGYYAVPFLDRDGPVEIDVATVEQRPPESPATEPPEEPRWSPSAPALSVAVAWPILDDVHVEVLTDDGDPPLAAAIELVSPRNKDRPRAREAFVAKCADHLGRGCGVVVVDVVTTRRADLHADLLSVLDAPPTPDIVGSLSAVAYRAIGREEKGQLLVWPFSLAIEQALPTVPLWLGADTVVPLDLEASHTAACVDLRIRQAG